MADHKAKANFLKIVLLNMNCSDTFWTPGILKDFVHDIRNGKFLALPGIMVRQAFMPCLSLSFQNLLEKGREVYEDFFKMYPYCYGYWKKYADLEKKNGNIEMAQNVRTCSICP